MYRLQLKLGLWLRLECSLDSLSIDSARKNQNPDQDCHGYALLITAVIFVDITSAILPLTSEYSFSLVMVRDLGLGLGLG